MTYHNISQSNRRLHVGGDDLIMICTIIITSITIIITIMIAIMITVTIIIINTIIIIINLIIVIIIIIIVTSLNRRLHVGGDDLPWRMSEACKRGRVKQHNI